MSIAENELRNKMAVLRNRLINVFLQFGKEHPEIPAQAHIGALGEMLIQFSVPQIGPQMTKDLLDHLKVAIDTSGTHRH